MTTIITKKIPNKPRSKNYGIGSKISFSGGNSVTVTESLAPTIKLIADLEDTEFTNTNALSSLRSILEIRKRIVKQYEETELTDDNVFSSLKVKDELNTLTAYVDGLIAEIYAKFLNKEEDATLSGLITFLKGWTTDDGKSNLYKDDLGNWHLKADYLHATRKIEAEEVEITKTSHIKGRLIQTAASLTCSKVEDNSSYYRCYFRNSDDNGNFINNSFVVGDLAYMETFNLLQHNNLTGNRFYWREIIGVGVDFIDLSKTFAAALSDVPMEGDAIVQLGNKTDKTRQGAIIQDGVKANIKLYSGINSFDLPDAIIDLNTVESVIKAVVKILPGSVGASNLEDLPDEIYNAVKIGGENLLLNTSFNGDYEAVKLDKNASLANKQSLFSPKLKYWEGKGEVITDKEAVSGNSINNFNISQNINLINDESYVISYKAKAGDVIISIGGFYVLQNTANIYKNYSHKFTYKTGQVLEIKSSGNVCDIKLERGTIPTDWCPNSLDTDPVADKFKGLRYINDSIRKGSTDILGGLILTNLLMLGNYSEDKLKQVTAGISGIYNNDNDPCLWGGGSLESSILTVSKYVKDPSYTPTEEDLKEMSNFVVTHGGRLIANDAVFRGHIYALGGIFKGMVEIAGGKILLNEDGSGQVADGNLYWDNKGVLFWKHQPRKVWRNIYDDIKDKPDGFYPIDLKPGTFLDATDPSNNANRGIILPPPTDYMDEVVEFRTGFWLDNAKTRQVIEVGNIIIKSTEGVWDLITYDQPRRLYEFTISERGAIIKSFRNSWVLDSGAFNE